MGVAIVALVSAAGGWALGQPGRDGPSLAPVASAARVTVAAGSEVLHDDVSASAVSSADYAASCDDFAGESEAVDLEALELTLTYGTSNERYEAFVRALESGVELPPELLRRTYATDPAEDMRLLALMTWADLVADDGAAVRAGLESAVYDGSSAVRAEAQYRLDELDRFERLRAEIPRLALP